MQSYAGARSLQIPCGQCLGCRLDKARDWATRMTHEAQMHSVNIFVTPTYDDQHLPPNGSLCKRDLQLFNKRLRNELGSFRFFASGEYGPSTLRPHYHAIYFGLDFEDKVLHKSTGTGALLYRSPTLDRIWGLGHILFALFFPESAEYVARYTTKKLGGEAALTAYERLVFDPVTGEPRRVEVEPVFALMSLRPGIGSTWFDQFASDAFPSDFVVIDGQKRPVPAYYRGKLSEREQLAIVAARKAAARKHAGNNTDARLLVRDESRRLKAKRLIRDLDQDD